MECRAHAYSCLYWVRGERGGLGDLLSQGGCHQKLWCRTHCASHGGGGWVSVAPPTTPDIWSSIRRNRFAVRGRAVARASGPHSGAALFFPYNR